MGKINSKQKGARGERELAETLRKHGYSECKRGVQYQGSPDSPDVLGLDGIHIEVKRTETLSLYTAMEQAKRDSANSGKMPTVFHRRNSKEWLVIMGLEDWLALYREWEVHNTENRN